MKGFYKGFKYGLSQMFVPKEQEMEIGGPTDVKHVAHFGMDGASGSAPSWMSEYKTGNDFSATAIGNSGSVGSSLSPWSSRELGDSTGQPEEASTEAGVVKKKERKKKLRSNTSPKSNNGSCSTKPRKPKSKLVEENAKPANIEVV